MLGVPVVKRNIIGAKHDLVLPRYEVSLITFAYLSFPRHPLSGLPSNTEDTDHKVDSRSKNYIKVKVNYRIRRTREIPLQFQQTNLWFPKLLQLIYFYKLHSLTDKNKSKLDRKWRPQTWNFLKDSFFSAKGEVLNLLTPNDDYSGRTAPLTSKRCILYIYSTHIGTEYFKHGIYSPFFSLQNAVCFIILTYLVPGLFTFYIQDVLKLKKNNSGAKRLTMKHWYDSIAS